jgi:very-short-patch-repair endonuclease
MGYPEWKVGVEYDGEQHWADPDDYADDIERLEFLASQRWIIVRVSGRQLRYDRATVLARVRGALAQYL